MTRYFFEPRVKWDTTTFANPKLASNSFDKNQFRQDLSGIPLTKLPETSEPDDDEDLPLLKLSSV